MMILVESKSQSIEIPPVAAVVSMFAFFSNRLSSNPTQVYSSFCLQNLSAENDDEMK